MDNQQLSMLLQKVKGLEGKPRPILLHPSDHGGVYWYRLRNPMTVLASALETKVIEEIYPITPQIIQAIEPIGIVTSRQTDKLEHILHYKNQPWIKTNHTPFIMDIDDNVWVYNPGSPYKLAKHHKRVLEKNLGRMNRVIVSTPTLAEVIRKKVNPDELVILPNMINSFLYQPPKQPNMLNIGKKPIALWAGSPTHASDLLLVAEAIKETSKLVDWVFFGYCPPELTDYVRFLPLEDSIYKYLQAIKALAPDIAIAPLVNNIFNASKSNLKLMEMGAIGAATIVSDTPSYADSPSIKIPNLEDKAAHNQLWIEAIRGLAINASLRYDMAARSHAYALQFNLDDPKNQQKVLDAYSPVIKAKDRAPKG